MKSKLKACSDWDCIRTDLDVLKLLEEIKNISFKFEDQKYQVLAIHNSKRNFYAFRQNDFPNSSYLTKFKNLSEISSLLEGNLYDEAILMMATMNLHPQLSDPRDKSLNPSEVEDIKSAFEDLYLALEFIQQADKKRYRKLQEELENYFTKGNNNYPTNMAKAYQLLNEFKNYVNGNRVAPSSGVSFAQSGDSKLC